MAIYVAIDKNFEPHKLRSLSDILEFSKPFHNEYGEEITKSYIAKNLNKFRSLKLYKFTEIELDSIGRIGYTKKEWTFIVHRI